MIVNISDYGKIDDKHYIVYDVSGLSDSQIEYLNSNLDDETAIEGDVLKIKMYFSPDLYPFQSEAAKFRLDDYIAREEIEMNIFLSSFLEDM